MVFGESFQLQAALIRQGASNPKGASEHGWKFEKCGDVDC